MMLCFLISFGVVLLINYFVGAIVWAACDDEEQTLLRWFKTAPNGFMQIVPFMTLQAWPLAVLIRFRRGRR